MNEYDRVLDMLENEKRKVERLSKVLDKVFNLCIDTTLDNKAMSGEHLLADDIIIIIRNGGFYNGYMQL